MTPHGSACRSIRRLSGHLCRKKDSTSAVRVVGWSVVIMVCIAIGVVYTGLGNRGREVNLQHITRIIQADIPSRATNSTVDGGESPGNGIQLSKEVHMKKVGDQGSPGIGYHRKKSPYSHETGQKDSQTAEIRGVGNAGSLVNLDSTAGRTQQLEDPKDIIIDEIFSDRGGVASANETTARSRLARNFDCPSNLTMTDPDNAWFRSSIAQLSPTYDVTDDATADDVIILTPISNVRRHLWKYFQNVCSLTYPHRHISIVLGEDSSSDQTLETAERMAAVVRPFFKRVDVLRLKGSAARTSGQERHEKSWQLNRRRHLAMARNQLLFGALGGGSEKWVLWLDSDVRHIPSDLVERFIHPQKGIVAANCLYRMDSGQTDTFDRNTWRDTEASRRRLQRMPDDFLMLEGYEQTERKFLNDLKGEGQLVRLDGVGGCALFVEADLHRKGLMFPAFVFDHHVETEGMAKMAARLGVEMYGLPSVHVIHW